MIRVSEKQSLAKIIVGVDHPPRTPAIIFAIYMSRPAHTTRPIISTP